jgi:hypothetical protein
MEELTQRKSEEAQRYTEKMEGGFSVNKPPSEIVIFPIFDID